MQLPSSYDPAEAEPRLQAAWAASKIYQFDLSDPRPIFAIDTPPPTVSGEIHIGHVYSYVQAEAMIRFWRMQGYNVYYPFGFDDNGLPTERFVERRRGFRARDVGREAFVQACLETSAEVEARFEEFWQRLGLSVDWRQRYSTIDLQARKAAQWSFIDLHRRGLIYRAQAPNPWCIECETAVAQAEMEDAERETIFYTLGFAIAANPGDRGAGAAATRGAPRTGAAAPRESHRKLETQNAAAPLPGITSAAAPALIPIATTRPELLAACVAVFVHPDDGRYRHLIGARAITPLFGRQVPILADSHVDPQKGSGAVMCCTFGDATDVLWWREYNLPLIPLVTRQGRLGEAAGLYAGLSLSEARTRIVADAREQGILLDERRAAQTVRVHERCATPLEILETRQWFIRVLDAKAALLDAGRRISWHPEHMRIRYEHWVENLSWDWCISRQRYYGVPFPVWHCRSCGATILADEAQLPIDPLADQPPRACACGSSDLAPDEDVMDTWATSSMSPQIAGQLFANPELYRRLFPMQLRPQAHDIIRTWSFYTIAKSLLHFGEIPWATLLISGHALDPGGRKFSKSKGNAPVTPIALIERYGADAVRYWACSASLGNDQPLSEEQMRQGRRLVTKLWNAARFCAQHLDAADTRAMPERQRLLPADRALLSRLQGLIAAAGARWRGYDYAGALELTERFFWGDFCDQYLELVKGRLYEGTGAARAAAKATIGLTLESLLKLFAPVLPHISEEIYQQLFTHGAGSIHTAPWPQADPALRDADAEQAGAAIEAFIGAIRRYKTARSRSLGTPLARLTIVCDDLRLRASLEQSALDLRSVARATELEWADQPGAEFSEIAPGAWLLVME